MRYAAIAADDLLPDFPPYADTLPRLRLPLLLSCRHQMPRCCHFAISAFAAAFAIAAATLRCCFRVDCIADIAALYAAAALRPLDIVFFDMPRIRHSFASFRFDY